jgi:hypothetical protein
MNSGVPERGRWGIALGGADATHFHRVIADITRSLLSSKRPWSSQP